MFLNNNTSNFEDDSVFNVDLATLNVLRIFNFWILLVIILAGFIGNLFAAIVIFLSSNLKRVSSNHYLIALALSDTVFIFGLFMIWINKLGLPTYHQSEIACKFVLFLLNSSGCLSAWYVAVLTIERFIVVYYPLYRQSICSVGRTRRAIIILVPWPILFNIWVLLAAGLIPPYAICDIQPDYYQLSLILNGIDMGISCVIPVFVIVSLNAAICIRLWARDQKTFTKKSTKKNLDPPDNGEDHEMRKHTGGANAKMQNQERKITQTLLIISFVYVALNLPSYAVRLRDSLMVATGANAADLNLLEKIIRNIFLLIYYTNFAINFIVYSLSSKNFRDAVFNVFKKKSKSLRNTSTATSSTYTSGKRVRAKTPMLSRTPSPRPGPISTVKEKTGENSGDGDGKRENGVGEIQSNVERADEEKNINENIALIYDEKVSWL